VLLTWSGAWWVAPADPQAEELPADTSQMEGAFNAFYAVDLDLEHPLKIQDLALVKDSAALNFKQGTVYLARPVIGQVTGAYFIGDGTMKLTPPTRTERKSLKRRYGKETFEEPFTEAVLRFDDGTDKELLAVGKPSESTGASIPTWASRAKLGYKSDDLQMDLLESRLNGSSRGHFFTADVNTPSRKWINYSYRDRQRIETFLIDERAGGLWYDPWCLFHKKSDYDQKGNYNVLPAMDLKDPTALRNVAMTVEIPNTKTVLVDARLRVEALVDGVRAIRFKLVNNIDAASWNEAGRPVSVTLVQDPSGAPLPYIHKWNQLLVLLPKGLAKGETAEVQVKATEDTIIQLTPLSFWIYTTYPWFPQIGYMGGRYTFDWTVKVAKPMKVAGSGEMVKEWEEGRLNCAQWRSATPTQFPSFIFGEFKTKDGVYKREPPASGEVALRLYAVRDSKVNEENILFNVQQGLKAYESIFGPFPYKDLDMAEMAQFLGFAQSPPGILLLNWVMGGAGGGGQADQVIFHELAHQWWGNQVGWAGPEDDWISESWAEYGAGLMTQGIDPKKFREKLKAWKKEAMEWDHEGTIASSWHARERRSRTALLYSKGPYVVHMLRSWMGWENFSKLTNTIQTKYRNTNINTDTLARETSTIMGYDMFPFFDQWVRDQGIPKVHYTWSAAPTEDGKFLVTVKARQEDAENFKFMMIPISLDFGKSEPVVVTKPFLKAEVEIQLKAPVRPTDVRLDDEASQLAEFIRDGAK
jgi:hypothetical protein